MQETEIYNCCLQWTEYLDSLEKQLNDQLRKAPSGSLHTINNHGNIQNYWRKDSKASNGTYIRKADENLVRDLAQKEYNLALLRKVQEEKIKTNKYMAFRRKNETNSMEDIYSKFDSLKKKWVQPIIPDEESFVENWVSVDYNKKGFQEDSPEYYTNNNLRVRSKSEILIAEKLDKLNIPYRYEYPISIKGFGVFYADFYCLNRRTRREFVYEHFGMADNPDYANNMIDKIVKYKENGYWPGVNMIYTFESSERPLNILQLEKELTQYLC